MEHLEDRAETVEVGDITVSASEAVLRPQLAEDIGESVIGGVIGLRDTEQEQE